MSVRLEFDDVSFAFGRRHVLERASFALEPGAATALIGPNGAGKTTLLRLAAGLLQPAQGHIALDGREMSAMGRRALARQIALVPQDLDVAFPFTVEQILEQGRTPYLGFFAGLKDADREVIRRAMEVTDVLALRHRAYDELSGGERQRVKMALGLAQEPRLLLLDEPTQNLDFGRQMEMISLMGRLRGEGITIFAAMHDLALIPNAFSSVVLLSESEGLMQGTPEEILQPQRLGRAFHCPPPPAAMLWHERDVQREFVR